MIDVLSPELKKAATPRQCEYIDAVLKYGSNSKAAEVMGVGRRTVDRAINAAKRAYIEDFGILPHDDTPRVLVLDIETAPLLANVWRMWTEVRNLDLILNDWYIMTWAAKWLGDDEVLSASLCDSKGYRPGSENDGDVVRALWPLLQEADYVVTHNGDNFDLKKINTRFLAHGLGPPAPYKSVDTLKIAKRAFSFTSNKLEYIAKKLLGEGKIQHNGIELWQRCIAGDAEAWKEMLEYNIKDVLLLEDVYYKLRAWDHLHPNFAVHTNKEVLACTVCGSENVKPTGHTVKTPAGAYLGYVCNECGHQMRGNTNIRNDAQRRATLKNAGR